MNLSPAIAALRHVGSYAAGAVSVLMFMGLSGADAQHIVTAITQISGGLADVGAGVTVLVPFIMMAFAAKSSTKNAAIATVNDTIPGVKVVAETAAAPTVTAAPK